MGKLEATMASFLSFVREGALYSLTVNKYWTETYQCHPTERRHSVLPRLC